MSSFVFNTKYLSLSFLYFQSWAWDVCWALLDGRFFYKWNSLGTVRKKHKSINWITNEITLVTFPAYGFHNPLIALSLTPDSFPSCGPLIALLLPQRIIIPGTPFILGFINILTIGFYLFLINIFLFLIRTPKEMPI